MPKLFFIVVASEVQGDAAHYKSLFNIFVSPLVLVKIPLRETLKNLFIYWEWSYVKQK
jgi:hypothetical protein